MNYLDFVASIISSLAWPSAFVGGVWIFRNEIRPLLPRLHLRHNETEVSFRLDEAEKVVEQLPPPAADAVTTTATAEEISHFEKIARLSPRAALLEMCEEVEEVLRSEATRQGIRKSWMTSPRQVLRWLRTQGSIDGTAANLFEDVLAIGNIAAQDQNVTFTIEDARRYRNLVDHAMRFFETPHVKDPAVYNLPPQE
ncbi:hypothetical protein OE766_05375 [Pararhizobium sp. YC-54]|uniref:hypothetical protein n=1 Tax=Pararhizobium sp. YC-54 TaxID=2986920 RepID=UPI0021F7E100|nr:hypothetical protein [Pararhizobium sp. YC-54]MCV9997670.1 hypothetical protein [Pararhizobium sp. YC-54]